MCGRTADGQEHKERYQAQNEQDGYNHLQRAGRPEGWPEPATVPARQAQRLCSRRSFISGQPGKDREHRPEPWLAIFQVTLYPVENLLLTGRQTHHAPLPGKTQRNDTVPCDGSRTSGPRT